MLQYYKQCVLENPPTKNELFVSAFNQAIKGIYHDEINNNDIFKEFLSYSKKFRYLEADEMFHPISLSHPVLEPLLCSLDVDSVSMNYTIKGFPQCDTKSAFAQNVKEIQFNNGSIRELGQSIGNFSKLEELSLREHNISELPKSFKKLQTLKKLDLTGNKFDAIPESLYKLPNLEELKITIKSMESKKKFEQIQPSVSLDITYW